MSIQDLEAMERIKTATRELLEENGDAESITIRQIARRAGVGVGLINYHFGSKSRLLGTVISERIEFLAAELLLQQPEEKPARERLGDMMKTLFTFGAEYKSFMQVLIREGFDSGEYGAELAIVPLLREIFGDGADEMRLRIMALQILHPIQVTCLATEPFKLYSGIDVEDPKQRARFVDSLIGNLI